MTNANELAIDRDAIAATAALIAPYVRRTPMMSVESADFDLDIGPLQLKLELLQHTGSFKPRGAFASPWTRSAACAWRGTWW